MILAPKSKFTAQQTANQQFTHTNKAFEQKIFYFVFLKGKILYLQRFLSMGTSTLPVKAQ